MPLRRTTWMANKQGDLSLFVSGVLPCSNKGSMPKQDISCRQMSHNRFLASVESSPHPKPCYKPQRRPHLFLVGTLPEYTSLSGPHYPWTRLSRSSPVPPMTFGMWLDPRMNLNLFGALMKAPTTPFSGLRRGKTHIGPSNMPINPVTKYET